MTRWKNETQLWSSQKVSLPSGVCWCFGVWRCSQCTDIKDNTKWDGSQDADCDFPEQMTGRYLGITKAVRKLSEWFYWVNYEEMFDQKRSCLNTTFRCPFEIDRYRCRNNGAYKLDLATLIFLLISLLILLISLWLYLSILHIKYFACQSFLLIFKLHYVHVVF